MLSSFMCCSRDVMFANWVANCVCKLLQPPQTATHSGDCLYLMSAFGHELLAEFHQSWSESDRSAVLCYLFALVSMPFYLVFFQAQLVLTVGYPWKKFTWTLSGLLCDTCSFDFALHFLASSCGLTGSVHSLHSGFSRCYDAL